MSLILPHLVTLLAALVTALITTPVARMLAWKLDAVDYPSDRRINKKPVPRMGGVAVFLGLLAAMIFRVWGSEALGLPETPDAAPSMQLNYPLLALSFVVIFATGVIDDIYQLEPRPKLIGQIIAAVLATASGLVIGRIVNPFAGGELDLELLAYPITVLYLVSYANIINLIDGLDGLASGISAISALTMSVIGIMAGRLDATTLSMAIAGASLGFLPYNFNPASIFLGDSGALLLGFGLGTVSLLNVTRLAGLTTIIIPLIVALIPILDTFAAIVRRRRAKVSVGQADKGHIQHRLIQEGFDQQQAVLLIYAWTALLCVGSIVMTQVETWPRVFIFAMLVTMSGMFATRLHLFEPVLRHHYDPKTGKDVLVSPEDPAFKIEEERAEEARSEMLGELHDLFLPHNDTPEQRTKTEDSSHNAQN